MKIVMITGSPHKAGSTALLADRFQQGAQGAGHQVVRFDGALAKVSPCLACEECLKNDGLCVQKDDMARLAADLLSCHGVALVTPLYYSGMSAQLKMVIDRFFAFDAKLRETRRRSFLLAACGDDGEHAMDPLKKHYGDICDYLNWEQSGEILAFGTSTPQDAEEKGYGDQAEKLGASL